MLASETQVPKSSSRKEEIVLEIKEYVDNHLQDAQLSIEQVADNFSFSVSYIRQLFKEIMNVSLSEYILQERIERVKEKLISSQLSVLEIADQCGFISKGHFSPHSRSSRISLRSSIGKSTGTPPVKIPHLPAYHGVAAAKYACSAETSSSRKGPLR